MKFTDIVGQDSVKKRLTEMVEGGKIPHALMLAGPEGSGTMPLAIAFAQYLLCKGAPPAQPAMGLFGMEEPEAPTDERPCGQCSSCKMSEKFQHPDLHFMFPIYKLKSGSDNATYCDDFINPWREMLLSNPYFTYSDWMEASGAENQQLTIYEAESDAIFKKLSLVASQGGYKICVVWLPEKMNDSCSNKMLKLLEEPPTGTIFIMASEHPEQLLQTIRSRVQMIVVPPIQESEIADALVTHNGIHVRKVKEMKKWSEEVAGMGRERQKHFLSYCQYMVRENFIYNFHNSKLNYMADDESDFAVKFAPFINENNVIGIMNELNLCERDITQNGNAKIVFFDFALKMIVLIKNR